MSVETIGWTEYELVPVGLYETEIVDVEEEETQFGIQLRVHFKLNHQNSQGENVILSRWISKKLSLRSNLFQLISAIDGEKPTKKKYPDGISVPDLMGKRCRVMIQHRESKDGNLFSRIETFLPFQETAKNKKSKQDTPPF